MTLPATRQATHSPYDSVTLRQRTTQPFLIPPMPEDVTSSPARIRVHLAIDDPELRAAVHALFGKDCFEVITGSHQYSARAEVCVSHMDSTRPTSPRADGTPVVLIGPDLRDETLLTAIRAGAWAFVSEQSSGEDLTTAVLQTAAGDCPILRSIAGRPAAALELVKLLSRREPTTLAKKVASPSPLSDGETEILRRVARGHNTRKIAGDLGFQEQTIKNRITSIFNKLGLRSRAGAVAEAQRRGWL